MNNLVDIIKKIVDGYLQSKNLSDVMYGTYLGDTLQIDSKPQKIPIDMVDVPERLRKYNVKFTFDLNQKQCDEQVFIILKDGSRLELKYLLL